MTREELFADKRFKNYDCLLIIGCTETDSTDEEECVDTAFVVYKNFPMFVQDGVTEPEEFNASFRKGAKVFSFDTISHIPDTRNCWTRQEIMDAYKYNSLYFLGTLNNLQENTECVAKAEKTLDDFSYEEIAEYLSKKCNFVYIFNEMSDTQLREVFNAICERIERDDLDIFWQQVVPSDTAKVCSEVIAYYFTNNEG